MKKRTYIIEINSENVCPDEEQFLHAVLSGFCDGYFGEGKASIKLDTIQKIEESWWGELEELVEGSKK